MKKAVITIVLMWLSIASFAQIAETFDEAKQQGISPHIDSVYSNAMNTDSSKAVFPGHGKEVYSAWVKLFQDMDDYLRKNGLSMDKPLQLVNRVYFNADGSVEHYLYKFTSDSLDVQYKAKFKTLANEFMKCYKFPMSSKVCFDQCGRIILTYPQKDKKQVSNKD